MKYVAFFAVIIIFQLLLVVSVLQVVRRRQLGNEAGSWLLLTGKVFLLMLAVNAIAIIPGIGLAAVVLWLVGFMRLSKLDVLSTFVLSVVLGAVNVAAMVVLARYLQISFV